MKIKNILIIGGSGTLGSYLINHLDKTSKIYILDKKKFYGKNENIKFIKFDFLKRKKLNKIPKKIDTVFFFAGIIGGSKSLKINSFKKYFKFNCQILVNFLKITEDLEIKKIVYTSTEHVYGDNEKINLANNSIEPNPKNFYGVSKLLAEKLLFKYFDKKKISIDILRFPRVIHDNLDNFIKTLIKNSIKHNQVFVECSNLSFNLIYLDDLMNALKNCMNQKKKKIRILNIFNNSKPISIYEIIHMIKEYFDIHIKVKNLKLELHTNHNPANVIVNNKFSKKELKWKPEFDNSKIIKKILNTYEVK